MQSFDKRCIGTLGTWCTAYLAQEPIPAKVCGCVHVFTSLALPAGGPLEGPADYVKPLGRGLLGVVGEGGKGER